MLASLANDFAARFGSGGELRTFFAPGRVNLIGEHTDYNGGHVFPCALTLGTYAVARARDDDRLRLFSKNFADRGVVACGLADLVYDEKDGWANYPKGVLQVFKESGHPIENGFDALFFGDVPIGAGLASSASIELVTAVMTDALWTLNVEMLDMVKMSQRAENEFIGVSCGIMDQFASGMGKKESAMLLDCTTLDYTYSPVKLAEASLVIANTNKSRGLTDSKYNERRRECEQALADLQQHVDIASLGELSIEAFEALQHVIRSDVCRRRARHAVYENGRTVAAVERLTQGDIAGFGQLMNQSHISLRDDYEVTGTELDALVAAAWAQDGVLGSRMTGAGFGGCTISIVNDSAIDDFVAHVGQRYRQETGLTAEFYVVEIGQGARELSPQPGA